MITPPINMGGVIMGGVGRGEDQFSHPTHEWGDFVSLTPASILRKTHTSPNLPIRPNNDESRRSFKKPNRRKSAPTNRTRQ